MIVTIFIIYSNLVCVYVLVAQVCLTLFKPVDYSLPGSSVQGIVQARILEKGSHLLLQGIFLTKGQNWVSCIAGRFFTI